jgi:hypothetical protein
MSDKRMIEVTPNIKKCLEVIKEAAGELPEGKTKENTLAALAYLEKTAMGEPQPAGGNHCPVGSFIIR